MTVYKMFPRIPITLLLILLLLSACAKTDVVPEPEPASEPEPIPEETLFTFTRENFPKLDGSTSTAPLAEAVCSVLLGEKREDVTDLVRFSKTTSAYYNLISGDADLLIVGEPNEAVLTEKEESGFQWEQTPFATDAFVFVVNEIGRAHV